MIKEVYYPKHLLVGGISHARAGADLEWQVAAGDTETVRGAPYTMQLAFGGRWEDAEVYKVTPEDVLETFVARLERWASRRAVNFVTFHNLKFDLQALLWAPRHRHWFAKPRRDFVVPLSDPNERAREAWLDRKAKELEPADEGEEPPAHKLYSTYLHCFTDKNWFAKLHLPSHRTVWIVDSRAFFPGSLESAAKLVGSPFQKLERPADPRCAEAADAYWKARGAQPPVLDEPEAEHDQDCECDECASEPEALPPRVYAAGEFVPGRGHLHGCRCLGEADLSDDPTFEEYARNDVLAQWHVGRAVADLHREYDVKTCVSLPHLASRIFRRRFVPAEAPIPFPPRPVARAAELSYHGGLNFMCVEPGWYRCHEIDINSAYTSAMTRMPAMDDGDWVEVDRVPDPQDDCWGFLKVSGTATCRYGVLFGHDFRKIRGPFEDVWVTTRDVASALRHRCATITRASGWVWRPSGDSRPFAAYAEFFWNDRKRFAKNTLESTVRKLLCNSLYGKTVQTTKFMRRLEVSGEGLTSITDVWKAGGIYNPCLGSWITSTVRADQLHEQAHAAEATVNGKLFPALHGSTDAIKTMVDPRDLPNIGPELGQWSVEVSGPCLLLRPKLYVHEKDGMDVRACKKKTCERCEGKGCGKVAYHGFRGDVRQLLDAAEFFLKGEEFNYVVSHCWTQRQALARKRDPVVPLDFERVELVLRRNDKSLSL